MSRSLSIRIVLCVFLFLAGISSVFPSDRFEHLLDSLLYVADVRNPLLRSYGASIEATGMRAAFSGKLPDPQFSVQWFAAPIYTRNGPQEFSLQLQQRFPWPGVLRYKQEAGYVLQKAEEARQILTRRDIHRKLKKLYAQLYQLFWQQHFVREHIQILTTIRTLVETRVETGKETFGNLFRIENEIALLQQRLRSLRRQEWSTRAQLFSLLSVPMDTALVFRHLPPLPERAENLSLDSLLGQAQRFYPLLQYWKQQQEAAALQKRSREAAALPSFQAGVNYVNIAAADIATPMAGQDALTFSVGLSLPLDRWRYQQWIEEQQLLQQQYSWNYQAAFDEVRATLAALLQSAQDLRDQIMVYQNEILPNTNRALEILLEEYATARVDIETLLMTERELLQYHEQEVIFQAKLFATWADIEFYTGATQ